MKIAADLLDLVGDSAFETVQDIIMVNIFIYCQVFLRAFWSFNSLGIMADYFTSRCILLDLCIAILQY